MSLKKTKEKRKLRLTIFDDHSFEEVRSIRLTRPIIFSILGGSFLIVTIIVLLLLVYTPLNMLIPPKASLGIKNKVIENSLLIDSLEQQILSEEKYLLQLKNILQGNIPTDTFDVKKIYKDSTITITDAEFESSDLDSIIRAELEESETGNLSQSAVDLQETIQNLHFVPPLKGIVSNEFDRDIGHFGIDIVPGKDETVMATLTGTVILATWSIETGYIIGIQHKWNLISFYKHNSVLLKKVGDRVSTGESIAIVGNSGEQTTGPHLHFELWYNGSPTNPRDFITF